MRRPEGPLREQRLAQWQQPRHRMDPRHVQRLQQRQRRQDARQAPRQHGLPRPGRTNHQDVVRPRRRHLQRTLGRSLCLHVGKVHIARWRSSHQRRRVGAHRLEGDLATEVSADLGERRRAAHRHTLHHRRLGHVGDREDQLGAPHRCRRERDRQRATHRTKIALEAELAEKERARKSVFDDLSAGRENPHGDREVERAAALGHISGREVDGDAAQRELIAGVAERGGDSLASLLDRAEREPDRGEVGKPVGDVHFDINGQGVDPENRGRADAGEQ